MIAERFAVVRIPVMPDGNSNLKPDTFPILSRTVAVPMGHVVFDLNPSRGQARVVWSVVMAFCFRRLSPLSSMR